MLQKQIEELAKSFVEKYRVNEFDALSLATQIIMAKVLNHISASLEMTSDSLKEISNKQ